MWGAIIGAGLSLASASSARKEARRAEAKQMALLRKSEAAYTRGGAEAGQLLDMLRMTTKRQYGNLLGQAREVGERQEQIAGGAISAARRRADALIPQAYGGAIMNNLNAGMSNTTAGMNFQGMAQRQALAAGGALEQQAGDMYANVIGRNFDRISGITGQGIAADIGIGSGMAAIRERTGTSIGNLWGNVQVAPPPQADMSWVGGLASAIDNYDWGSGAEG